ncbi:MAG: hypothetical protein PSV16_12395 [Flavobacterium sp.]|nr:hypothetical protein [Flavobacterium sp.]
MQQFGAKVLSFFFLGVIIFVPLPFLGIPFQLDITQLLFSKPVTLLQQHFFEDALLFVYFSSDTIALNLLLVLLFLLSILLVLVVYAFKIKTEKLIYFARISVVYYLIFILLKYGFDKIFLQQFYQPEPNILYAEFGKLSKDILYWSTMGLSPTFSIVTGIIEVLVAVLLIFKRTRAVGLLLSILVLANIVLINFAFDISVKTFSCLLLGASIFAIFLYLKAIWSFFILQKSAELHDKDVQIIKIPHFKIGVKFFAISIFLLQILYPYLFDKKEPNQNLLSGAYEVITIIKDGDTLSKEAFPVKRIFFSKKAYLVFESNEGIMKDYFVKLDTGKQLETFNYNLQKNKMAYDYDEKDSILSIEFEDKNHFKIKAKAMKFKKLPALQDDFHFTIDGIK